MNRTPRSISRRVIRHLRPKSFGQLRVEAVHFPCLPALGVQIDRLGGGGLHAVRQLIRMDARLEFGIARMPLLVGLVQILEKIQRVSLSLIGDPVRRFEVQQRRACRCETGCPGMPPA